jgi:hypothetical protein
MDSVLVGDCGIVIAGELEGLSYGPDLDRDDRLEVGFLNRRPGLRFVVPEVVDVCVSGASFDTSTSLYGAVMRLQIHDLETSPHKP